MRAIDPDWRACFLHYNVNSVAHSSSIGLNQKWPRMSYSGNGCPVVKYASIPGIGLIPGNIVGLWMRVLRVIGWQVSISVKCATYFYAVFQCKYGILNKRQDVVT